MAFENVIAKLITSIVKGEAQKKLISRYAPPSHDDILHDGLVGAGELWGGILGGAAGGLGGEALGGPVGGIAGGVALGSAGALAGGWGAHGAYRGGQLIKEILSHPENWTVDAAGAIVPVMPAPPSDDDHPARPAGEPPVRFVRSRPANVPGEGMDNWSAPYLKGNATDRQDAGASSGPAPSGRVPAVPYWPQALQGIPGGIPGLIAAATGNASSDPTQFQPPAGGILGMIQDYMNGNAMPNR